jgi:hypothetical protein
MTWRGTNGLYVARKLGLVSGLQLVLDAGDAASYASGQPWLDLSGNGYDFNRGATLGSEASDPTFNGTAGRLSSGEYFSCDGGDHFRYDSANETWMHNLHKDNARFTAAMWVQFGAVDGTTHGLFGTRGTSGNTGQTFYKSSGNILVYAVANAGSGVIIANSSLVPTAGVPAFVALSVDEASATGGLFQLNAVHEAFNPTYSAPSSGNASFALEIGARGNGDNPARNLSRFWQVWMWEGRVLSAGELHKLRDATRGRYGV